MAAKKYVKHLFKMTDRFMNYLMLICMLELDIGLIDGVKLNFDQSFLQFNVKKKLYAKSSTAEY